ncbi:hypothetical protein NEF87_002135 [Candidatus Lokiarchaeum ossiferum]|uniref:Uncharacterized protein n=1 Tax=Candidatus Lokiarchaeum ossiferum TaxID=2951803 RepID=A0ABY6HQR8_9ARCH|nr:hypothetical protein NEF87_002135 [Candidatus Lokiarchaeum sp. B-35]
MFSRDTSRIMREQTDQYRYRHEDYKRSERPLDDTDLRKKQMSKKSFLEKYDRKITYLILGAIFAAILIFLALS